MYYRVRIFSTINAAYQEVVLFKYDNVNSIPRNTVRMCLKKALKELTPYGLEVSTCKAKNGHKVVKTYEELEKCISELKFYKSVWDLEEQYEDVAVFATDEPRFAMRNSYYLGKWYTFFVSQFYVKPSHEGCREALLDLGITVRQAKDLNPFSIGKYVGVYEKGKPWKLQKFVGEKYVAHQKLLEQ